MNSIALMLAITAPGLDEDTFRGRVAEAYQDGHSKEKLSLAFGNLVKNLPSQDREVFKGNLIEACFNRTPLGRMLKQFGFESIYEIDIYMNARGPDVIFRIARSSKSSADSKLTITS